MSHNDSLTSGQLEAELCSRLEAIRLNKNISQGDLARNAGISRRTVSRMENGRGISLDTFIRVIKALDLTDHLVAFLPATEVQPIERVRQKHRPRQRASRSRKEPDSGQQWEWGD